MKLGALLLVYSFTANAGLCNWLFNSIVADDPHQYDETSQEWLEREHDRLRIRERWRTITADESIHLRIIKNQLQYRMFLENLK